MKVDLIVKNAAQIVTCRSGGKPKRGAEMRDIGLIENGAIAVKDGLIAEIGDAEKISRDFESNVIFDAENKVVCPAFVESHTHIVFAGNRLDEFELKIKGGDYLEILESGGGIISTVRKTREASLEELIEQTRKRLEQLLELGVATCEIKTGYGLDTETELKMLEVIAELDKTHAVDLIPTFLPAHAVPFADFKARNADLTNTEISDSYTNLVCEEMIPKAVEWYKKSHFHTEKNNAADSALEFFIDVFCEKNAFTLKQTKYILETGRRFGMQIKAHVDEFTNLGGARLAIELGATSIDHLDATSDEEIKLLAESDTVGIVTPTVNFNFGSAHFADARKMIDANCAIALSTDFNPGSAPCPSLPNAMAIACRYQKLLPSETFNAATINAAFAVGSGEKTGSLEIGKQADFLILDVSDYRHIAYEFGGNLVEKVFKNGKIVCERK